METSLIGEVQFVLRKGEKTPYPRGETPIHYIAMGYDDDLREATHKAVGIFARRSSNASKGFRAFRHRGDAGEQGAGPSYGA